MALRCSEPDCNAKIRNLAAPVVMGYEHTLGNIIPPNPETGARGNGVLRCTVCAVAMALERVARDALGGVTR